MKDLAPEPSREVVACKDILTECHELLSQHAKGVLDDAMFVLKQVSMAQRVAYEAALQSIVLLKNSGGALPLGRGGTLAVDASG